jgi:hypothetical protein
MSPLQHTTFIPFLTLRASKYNIQGVYGWADSPVLCVLTREAAGPAVPALPSWQLSCTAAVSFTSSGGLLSHACNQQIVAACVKFAVGVSGDLIKLSAAGRFFKPAMLPAECAGAAAARSALIPCGLVASRFCVLQ